MLRSYIAFDLETTGLDPQEAEILEIGALKVREGKVAERFMEFIRPTSPVSEEITQLTGITNEMVKDARNEREVVMDFLRFCEEDVLIGHNVMFDYKFMKTAAQGLGQPFEKMGIDTLKIARKVHPELESKSLGRLCGHYQIENKAAHRAYHDALATAKLYQTLAHYFEEREPRVFLPCPLSYKAPKILPATKKQMEFLKRLAFQYGIEASWPESGLTKNEASRLITEILKANGGMQDFKR